MREIKDIDEITCTSFYTTLWSVKMTIVIVNKFQEGWKAFFSAKTIADCPYMPASKDAEMWCEGYSYARGEEYNDIVMDARITDHFEKG